MDDRHSYNCSWPFWLKSEMLWNQMRSSLLKEYHRPNRRKMHKMKNRTLLTHTKLYYTKKKGTFISCGLKALLWHISGASNKQWFNNWTPTFEALINHRKSYLVQNKGKVIQLHSSFVAHILWHLKGGYFIIGLPVCTLFLVIKIHKV